MGDKHVHSHGEGVEVIHGPAEAEHPARSVPGAYLDSEQHFTLHERLKGSYLPQKSVSHLSRTGQLGGDNS